MTIENKSQEATRWLLNHLKERGGQSFATDILDLAGQVGISETTVRRVRKILPIISRRQGFGRGARWFWELDIQGDHV